MFANQRSRPTQSGRLTKWVLWRIGLHTALPALMSVMVGCTHQLKPVAPPVALPAEFSENGTEAMPDKWWQGFKDQALNELIEQALNDNFNLQTAWDRLAQAQAIAQKEGADLYPAANLSGLYNRTRQETKQATDYSSQYQLGLAISYEVDLWGRIRAGHQAATLDVQASRDDVASTAIALSSTIAKTWYQLAEAHSQMSLINDQIETNEKVLQVITVQFRQGKITAADVLRQRQLIASSQGQLILAKQQAEVLKNQLAVLLGLNPAALSDDKTGGLVELPGLPSTPLPSELIQRRPDVHSAYLAIQAADQRVAAAIADQFPKLSLSAGLDTSGSQARDLFDNWLANLAGNLAQPLLDGNRRRAEVRRTEAVLSEKIHQYAQAILTSLQEVEDALVQEKRQREYLSSLNEQLQTAQMVIDRTRQSYAKGQLDYLRVLEGLISQQSLQRNSLTAQRELIERRIDLCRAIAGGWEMQSPPLASLK